MHTHTQQTDTDTCMSVGVKKDGRMEGRAMHVYCAALLYSPDTDSDTDIVPRRLGSVGWSGVGWGGREYFSFGWVGGWGRKDFFFLTQK
jgi:hypothetical protein